MNNLVAELVTYACSATWWLKLEPMQVVLLTLLVGGEEKYKTNSSKHLQRHNGPRVLGL